MVRTIELSFGDTYCERMVLGTVGRHEWREEAEAEARRLDQNDDLSEFRERFHIPLGSSGKEKTYLCGNSLGLMPKSTSIRLQSHLQSWQKEGVGGHFTGAEAWLAIEDLAGAKSGDIVGAKSPLEIVYMNSLTVNIHLMMVSFYRPTDTRYKILIEHKAFPSDDYATQSQVKFHGHDPDDAIIRMKPREGEHVLREEDILDVLEKESDSIALVFFPGVQYYTGQVMPMESIARVARDNGIAVGFDLAHAVGNVELHLHDWEVDFAVWCSYKYLNSGPGSVSGVFIHEKHAHNQEIPRFAGWWGYDRKSRFQMLEQFIPQPGAYGFQLSNPPVFATVPVACSLDIFAEAEMPRVREKSIKLTSFLETLLVTNLGNDIELITPRNKAERGSQLSIRLVRSNVTKVHKKLEDRGVVCDTREPDVMRIAPVPLYNTFFDIFTFVQVLEEALMEVAEEREMA